MDTLKAEQVAQRVFYERFAKINTKEYKPYYLRAFSSKYSSLALSAIARKNYGLCLMKDVQFGQTWKALMSVKAKGSKTERQGQQALF